MRLIKMLIFSVFVLSVTFPFSKYF